MTEEEKKELYGKAYFRCMKTIRKNTSGQTLTEVIVIVGILAIVSACVFGFFSKHVLGNKQVIDFNHQRFTTAYVLGNSNIWEKVSIKAWKDWEDSDAIQIITPGGKAIYTHLSNVKLVQE